jgi:hypothetical protein
VNHTYCTSFAGALMPTHRKCGDHQMPLHGVLTWEGAAAPVGQASTSWRRLFPGDAGARVKRRGLVEGDSPLLGTHPWMIQVPGGPIDDHQ